MHKRERKRRKEKEEKDKEKRLVFFFFRWEEIREGLVKPNFISNLANYICGVYFSWS